jgi:membrane protease YdiL (CAAX protease family)
MKTSLKLVVTYLLIQTFVGLLVGVVSQLAAKSFHADEVYVRQMLFAPSLLLSLVLMFVVLQVFHFLPRNKERWSFISWKYALLTILIGFCAVFIMDCLTSYLEWIPDWMKQTFDTMSTNPFGIIAITLAGPLLEELLFRGAILRTLLEKYSPKYAILWSAVLFGVSHLNPSQIIAAFVMGLLLGAVYYRTRSIIPGLIIHIVNNSVSVLCMMYYPNAKSMRSVMDPHVYFILLLLALFFFLFAVYFMRKVGPKTPPATGEENGR